MGGLLLTQGPHFIEITQKTITRFELSEISKMVTLDEAVGESPQPRNFRAYLRNHLRVRDASRTDPSKDVWGTPYLMVVRQEEEGVTTHVTSAGPDQLFGTQDDLKAWIHPPAFSAARARTLAATQYSGYNAYMPASWTAAPPVPKLPTKVALKRHHAKKKQKSLVRRSTRS